MAETPEPVIVYTVFFELPWWLGLDHIHVWTYSHQPPWAGWDRSSMANYIGAPAPLPEGLRPQYRVAFRTLQTRTTDHLRALELAFFDELSEAHGHLARLRRRVELWRSLWRGEATQRTVVGVTYWAPRSDPPRARGETVEQQIVALNDFLTSLGLITSNPRIGSLSLDQLPAESELIAALPHATGWVSKRMATQIGPWTPALLRRPRPPAELAQAALVFQRAVTQNDPTFRVVALLWDSRRDLLSGRLIRAVTFSGIAIELLVQSTIERAWTAAGLDPGRVAGALRSGFKNQVQDHLGRVLGLGRLNVTDLQTEIGRWWAASYGLRDGVVHRGQHPTQQQAQDAVATAFEVAAFCGRALGARPETQQFQGMLPTHRIIPERYADLGKVSGDTDPD